MPSRRVSRPTVLRAAEAASAGFRPGRGVRDAAENVHAVAFDAFDFPLRVATIVMADRLSGDVRQSGQLEP